MTHYRKQITNRPVVKRKIIKRKSRDDLGPKYFVSIDLGQLMDYTALTIVERVFPTPENEVMTYRLRHVERYELGTSYPEIVRDVCDLMEEDFLKDNAALIVDGTGVGIPVVEMFREAGLTITPIWITGGG